MDIDDFIDAMFFRSKNSYRLLNTEFAEPIDYFNSELQLKNMKRLKPIVRGVEAEEVDKTPLEEYWLRNISTGYCNSLYFEGTGILTAKNGDVKKGTWNHTVNLMETARF